MKLEAAFNRLAGFADADDELPWFFHDEKLAPTNKAARLTSQEVNRTMQELVDLAVL